MHIYRLLILLGHVMGWAFDWAAARPRPSLGLIVWLLRVPGSLLVVF